MKALLLGCSEFRSARFERLVEVLGETPADIGRIKGALVSWMVRWAEDAEYDAGVLFDVTTDRMGMWAEWPKPRAFGCALVKAGYVEPVEKVYPAELLMGENNRPRNGYVALGYDGRPSLETSWHGVQRLNGAKARKWCLFLLEPDRRWASCAASSVDVVALAADGRVPGQWADEYMAWCAVRGMPVWEGGAGPPEETPEPAPESAPESPLRYGSHRNRNPVEGMYMPRNRDSVVPLRVVGDGGGASSGRGGASHVREGNGRKGSNGSNSRTARRGTGAAKGPDLLAMVQSLMHADPQGALRALDGGGPARTIWDYCSDEHPAAVKQCLAELIDCWDTVRNPAGWVMNRMKKLYRNDRRGERITGAGSSPTGRRAAAEG